MDEFDEDMEFVASDEAGSNSTDDFNDLLYGSICFVCLAFVLSLIIPLYISCTSSDQSMDKTNMSMACGLAWLVTLYMWIGWATLYKSKVQNYILILPKLQTSGR